MKPESYREQLVPCCATCKHSVDVNAVPVHICGFGENLTATSYYNEMLAESSNPKYYYAGDNHFDQGDFLDEWCKNRHVYPFDICDNYEAVKQ